MIFYKVSINKVGNIIFHFWVNLKKILSAFGSWLYRKDLFLKQSLTKAIFIKSKKQKQSSSKCLSKWSILGVCKNGYKYTSIRHAL